MHNVYQSDIKPELSASPSTSPIKKEGTPAIAIPALRKTQRPEPVKPGFTIFVVSNF